MVKEHINLLMVINILDNLHLIKEKDMVNINLQMEIFMKENIVVIEEMEKEYFNMQMEIEKLVNIWKVNQQENIKFIEVDKVVHLKLITIIQENWIQHLLQVVDFDLFK